ncbi:hypothetical protein BC936DRAFT_141707 [Jimgerdemannia flammicorona]|uniref:Uncharacterized protein n=1 Tax=Jimgerdemannia flammicorona TaxID=994334 RepID=A0A433DFU2_9FUNG|nr:hypothetical protein BC936DRAFT_141707 [Jimgerdemannia flammicorona]
MGERVGGSEIAAILGLTPNSDIYKVIEIVAVVNVSLMAISEMLMTYCKPAGGIPEYVQSVLA